MKTKIFYFLICLIIFFSTSYFAYSGELSFEEIFKEPTQEEIKEVYTSFNKKFSCQLFKKKKLLYEDSEMEIFLISYKSDGLKIYGLTAYPKKEGKFPVIIYNHGGLGLNFLGFKLVAEQLVKKGYIIFASSYRGQPAAGYQSAGKIKVGFAEVRDVLNLIECAKKDKKVEKEKIILLGGSHGGWMTLMTATFAKFNSCICIAGPTNFFDEYYKKIFKIYLEDENTTLKDKDLNYLLQVLKKLFPSLKKTYAEVKEGKKSLKELRQFLISISPLYFSEKITCPLFLIYADQDKLVPLANLASLEKELKKYNKNYKSEIVAGMGHGQGEIFKNLDKVKEMLNKTLEFIEENLRKEK